MQCLSAFKRLDQFLQVEHWGPIFIPLIILGQYNKKLFPGSGYGCWDVSNFTENSYQTLLVIWIHLQTRLRSDFTHSLYKVPLELANNCEWFWQSRIWVSVFICRWISPWGWFIVRGYLWKYTWSCETVWPEGEWLKAIQSMFLGWSWRPNRSRCWCRFHNFQHRGQAHCYSFWC